MRECLESIKHQKGHLNFEIVWINDGSNASNTNTIKKLLKELIDTTRWTSIKYFENGGNKGIGYSLNHGVKMCTHELIIKMDSDDVMSPERIAKQYMFMLEHPD